VALNDFIVQNMPAVHSFFDNLTVSCPIIKITISFNQSNNLCRAKKG